MIIIPFSLVNGLVVLTYNGSTNIFHSFGFCTHISYISFCHTLPPDNMASLKGTPLVRVKIKQNLSVLFRHTPHISHTLFLFTDQIRCAHNVSTWSLRRLRLKRLCVPRLPSSWGHIFSVHHVFAMVSVESVCARVCAWCRILVQTSGLEYEVKYRFSNPQKFLYQKAGIYIYLIPAYI